MSKRRTRLEIILTILSNIMDGLDKPTRIMYATNMSWAPTQKILSNMVEQDLIKVSINTKNGRSKKRYVITEKGIKVIDYFEKATEIVSLEWI